MNAPGAGRVDWAVGLAIACGVQGASVFLLASSGGTDLRADLSDEHARPIAVAITPVVDDAPVLKLGGKRDPRKLPDLWQAPRPVARTTRPPSPREVPEPGALPSPLARETPTARLADAGAAPIPDAELTRQADLTAAVPDAGPAPNTSVAGAADGVKEGTETDPLKAHAVGLYRARLDAWFSARFPIRGKIPFETLKTLRAGVSVSVGAGRNVTGFSIARPSGNPVFDATLRAALSGIEASGAELPPPPPMYPDVLGTSLGLSFSCTSRSACE